MTVLPFCKQYFSHFQLDEETQQTLQDQCFVRWRQLSSTRQTLDAFRELLLACTYHLSLPSEMEDGEEPLEDKDKIQNSIKNERYQKQIQKYQHEIEQLDSHSDLQAILSTLDMDGQVIQTWEYCRVCKKRQARLISEQTRSADEGSTTFVLCQNNECRAEYQQ